MSDLSQVKRQHTIVDVLERLGHTPPPQWNGTSEFFINCPAPGHDDATPSCRIHPDSGRFHCFGCGAHGDIFDLASLVAGYRTFAQALQWITGNAAPAQKPRPATPRPVRRACQTSPDRILDINAAAWAHLTSCARARLGRNYLASRGLHLDRLENAAGFPLAGFTPSDPAGLTGHLMLLGFRPVEIIDAGWTISTPRGLRDRFRRRVLFPVRDAHQRVLAVIGRDVTGTARAKYLNTPTTSLYRKGDNLYAPRWPTAATSTITVCEGPIDALALASANSHVCAVSPCGTALTARQAQLTASLRLPVDLMADGDAAGRAANTAWSTQLLRAGATARIRPLPNGRDPASHPLAPLGF